MDNEKDGARRRCMKTIQQSSTAAEADLVVELPPDVITEILIKLPARSIQRFKRVCKSWYALFSDPKFIEKHVKASAENREYANHKLIMHSFCSKDVTSCSIPSVLHREYSISHPLHYPWRSPDAHVWIVGSVNGLVLIIIDSVEVFLWNPALMKSRVLPLSGFKEGSSDEDTEDTNRAYGFGYDETSSDYKVMVINTDFERSTRTFKNQVKMYGLESDSWREIENFPDCELSDEFGKFICGALHWTADFGTGLNKHRGILVFNLSEETFSEISQPFLGESYSYPTIEVLDGCLCVLYNFGGTKVDIWKMNEYGKIESWSMKFSIALQYDPLDHKLFALPLFISKKNEVLLKIGKKLVLYNADSNTISFPVVENFFRIFEITTYIETLVSPCAQRSRQQNRSNV